MTDDMMDETNDNESIDDARLRALLERVAELPRIIEPPADAWAGIQSAIMAPVTVVSQAASPRRPVAFWQQPVFLAAAAALLVIGSSVLTAKLMGPGAAAELPRPVAVAPAAERPPSGGPATLAEFTVIENDYIRMANQLTEAVQSDESRLAPETIAKLNESLRVIDAAILEARRALAHDPANRAIVDLLSGSYEQKLDLLRRTTEMARS